ncbi:hypothetical protein GCM10023321_50360 [Pseudonocardia eucalypti]|uniref:Uncharacterized protein n=1 Tax=Pseudonocardia eucalypti TaxID=648755 RepID=A0ABP9QKY3_9PSEU
MVAASWTGMKSSTGGADPRSAPIANSRAASTAAARRFPVLSDDGRAGSNPFSALRNAHRCRKLTGSNAITLENRRSDTQLTSASTPTTTPASTGWLVSSVSVMPSHDDGTSATGSGIAAGWPSAMSRPSGSAASESGPFGRRRCPRPSTRVPSRPSQNRATASPARAGAGAVRAVGSSLRSAGSSWNHPAARSQAAARRSVCAGGSWSINARRAASAFARTLIRSAVLAAGCCRPSFWIAAASRSGP